MKSRREVITQSLSLAGAAALGVVPRSGFAQSARIRLGLMLPYTGTFAQLGIATENGLRMAIDEQGGKLGGREIDWFKLDDESDPSRGVENASRLVLRDKVDVLVGSVHSGVQMGIHKVVRETGVLNIIPTAGVNAATRSQCAPNVFRTSFTTAQGMNALGQVVAARGHKKVAWVSWKYAAGDESLEGFKETFIAPGRTITRELWVPFPNVEFQALLTEIALHKPDAVVCFLAGAGGAKFIKDWNAAGLKGRIPLYGTGLTEGVLGAVGTEADGIISTYHYSDALDTPRNKAWRLAYVKAFRMQPDGYAVQGYDAGILLALGAKAVNGDLSNTKALYQAMESAVIDSPRGKWKLSKSHNPIQDYYLRVVQDGENKVLGVAVKALADSGAGCRMG
jgi:branched-chain amino acid transport system substrate-binding protein